MVNPKDNFCKKRNMVSIKLVSSALGKQLVKQVVIKQGISYIDNSLSKKERYFEQYI